MLLEYEGYDVEPADTSEVPVLSTTSLNTGEKPMLPPQRGHRFHQDAVEYLVYYFAEITTKPRKRVRAAIAEDIGLSPTQVHNWFKMSRRKERKSVPIGMVY
jgi:hypothetical protein